MIFISHRGNINGPNPARENSPDYILEALEAGYDVEVDVWYVDGKFYLGHDKPQYEIHAKVLLYDSLWIHVKNIEALHEMRRNEYHYFWHQTDQYTLTSYNWIWTYPRVLEVNKSCIIGMPELYPDHFNFTKVGGMWSDNISYWRDKLS